MNDTEVTCPYCEKEFDVDTDDGAHYKDGQAQEEQCPNCEKVMLVTSTCTWYREAEKADCLNGSPHAWSIWSTYWIGEKGDNVGKYYERRYCEICYEDEWEYHEERLDKTPSERFDK